MIVLVMGRRPAARKAVATALAETLAWPHIHVADDFGQGAAARIELLRPRMAAGLSAGRAAIYSCPHLSAVECRTLRESLRPLELVRLLDSGEQMPPLASALTLDGQMEPSVVAATIAAVLRLGNDARKTR